ncbi:MAG: serine hydrolase domain-containing protein [Nocardioidaceae bacterium]
MTEPARSGVDQRSAGQRGPHQRCSQIVTSAYDRGRPPSISAAVFHRGEIGWRAEFGDAGRQYRIGSITKTFTAVAVMRLRDRGVVRLDDPIGTHLPDAPYADHTIAQLLTHSSGMTAEPAGPWWERTPGRDWGYLARANATSLDVFAAGERHHYSNLGYGLLGKLVARLEGGTWWDVVESSLARPLGLTETTYLPGPDAAVGTSRDPRDGRLMREPAHDAAAMAPAGQLWSTVDDLARWAEFLAVGHDAVLSSSTLAQMRVARAADPLTQHRGAYGLGFRLRWRPASTLLGHTGSMPGFVAALFVDATSRVGGVVLANTTTGLEVETLVADLIDAAEPAYRETAAWNLSAPPEPGGFELVGEWYWGNVAMMVAGTGDGFTLTSEGLDRGFVQVDDDRYRGLTGYFAGEELRVVRRDDGAVSHLEVVTFIFTRIPYDSRAPIPGGPPEPL